MFNTCRVPRERSDKIANYFKTDKEGEVPAHIVVLRKGHLFKVPLFDSVTGKNIFIKLSDFKPILSWLLQNEKKSLKCLYYNWLKLLKLILVEVFLILFSSMRI